MPMAHMLVTVLSNVVVPVVIAQVPFQVNRPGPLFSMSSLQLPVSCIQTNSKSNAQKSFVVFAPSDGETNFASVLSPSLYSLSALLSLLYSLPLCSTLSLSALLSLCSTLSLSALLLSLLCSAPISLSLSLSLCSLRSALSSSSLSFSLLSLSLSLAHCFVFSALYSLSAVLHTLLYISTLCSDLL